MNLVCTPLESMQKVEYWRCGIPCWKSKM